MLTLRDMLMLGAGAALVLAGYWLQCEAVDWLGAVCDEINETIKDRERN